MSEAPDAVVAAIGDALSFTVAGDSGRARAAVDVLLEHGVDAVYAACCAWADVIARHVDLSGDAGEFVRLEVVDADRTVIDPGTVASPEGQARIWTGRFVAAHINGDGATRVALFNVATPEDCARNVMTLLRAAGSATKVG